MPRPSSWWSCAGNSRGVEVDDEYRVGEDVAVPRSRLVDYVAALEAMAARRTA